jgi:ribosomal small subunit protein bTHX
LFLLLFSQVFIWLLFGYFYCQLNNYKNQITMGKGDRKTAKGKRFLGSTGVSRQKKKTTAKVATVEKPKPTKTTKAKATKTTEKKTAAKKTTTKATTAKKTTAKKTTTKKAAAKKEE